MKKALLHTISLAVLSTLFCACLPINNSVPARFYTLAPKAPESLISGVPVENLPFGRISIPTYLDTPQIITRAGENRVVLNENDRWAEPLARGIQRMLPRQTAEFVHGKKLKKISQINVAIDRLDGECAGKITLMARITIVPENSGKQLPAASSFSAVVPAQGEDLSGYVNAISSALENLAKEIARQITE